MVAVIIISPTQPLQLNSYSSRQALSRCHPNIQKPDHKEKGLLYTQLGHHACFTCEVVQDPLVTYMHACCLHGMHVLHLPIAF